MISVVFSPWRTSWSRSAWPYHFEVAPPQPAMIASAVERVDHHRDQRQPEERDHQAGERRADRVAADRHQAAVSSQRLRAVRRMNSRISRIPISVTASAEPNG